MRMVRSKISLLPQFVLLAILYQALLPSETVAYFSPYSPVHIKGKASLVLGLLIWGKEERENAWKCVA